ncbi:MAG: hypothetical protein COA43_05980 [Robiginitomaculum sp.]|nr:MAG: hypothetical protein COA43_05980 [Robiginitomaculum sp.]
MLVRGMSTKERIGRRVKAIRKQKGLTQAQLAELIDRSEDALSQIERGLNFPHVSTIERISIKLGVPLETFFDSIEGDESTPKRAGLQARLTALTNELDDAGLALAAEIIESIQKRGAK